MDAASDYVQGFFLELIDKEFLATVSPEKGRFRWFMMSAIGRFVSKQTAAQKALKRGGDKATFSLDVQKAEERYQREPIEDWTPEKLFDRRWALEVLAKALAKLEEEHEAKGKLELYRELQGTLGGEALTAESCEAIGERLGMSPVAVKVAAHRLKDKYRTALVDVVSNTLADPESVDDELDNLFQALAG
jgi:RNA polymerase sigma-70 factor (ECF subfamily)